MQGITSLRHLCSVGATLGVDPLRFGVACVRSRMTLAAENLFLRKQLALYREREVKPRRATDATRLVLVLLARVFPWRDTLLIVQPATLIRWHRQAVRLVWRWRSRGRGRPRIPSELRRLIRAMAQDNPTWGERRIAAELLVKLGLRVSSRTVRRYIPKGSGETRRGATSHHWRTFVRNHASVLLACDFCVVVTARFRVLYVFVAMESGSRRLAHVTVTSHPTAANNAPCHTVRDRPRRASPHPPRARRRRTGTGAWWTTCAATLPSTNRLRPLRPCVDIATKSIALTTICSRISSAASP